MAKKGPKRFIAINQKKNILNLYGPNLLKSVVDFSSKMSSFFFIYIEWIFKNNIIWFL